MARITVDPRTPRAPYRVHGERRALRTVADAAQLATERRDMLDREARS